VWNENDTYDDSNHTSPCQAAAAARVKRFCNARNINHEVVSTKAQRRKSDQTRSNVYTSELHYWSLVLRLKPIKVGTAIDEHHRLSLGLFPGGPPTAVSYTCAIKSQNQAQQCACPGQPTSLGLCSTTGKAPRTLCYRGCLQLGLDCTVLELHPLQTLLHPAVAQGTS